MPCRPRPGQVKRYLYNSLTAYLTGLVLEAAAGEPVDRYADQHLFRPLGIMRWRWRHDAAGRTTTQGNLELTVRDFARIGEMVRHGGAWRGRRIVSADWLRDSLRLHVSIGSVDRYADGYGYFWYAKRHEVGAAHVDVSFASGNGGNKIYIVPARRMVVAIQSSAYGRGYGQRRSEQILLRILETTK
ncbi:MAG: serine hydrolase domain-containing protein [Vicinamibacteraceae bacterium]